MKGFGFVRGFEDRTPGSLVPVRIGEERAFEVTADPFYSDLVAASWVIRVSSDLVHSKGNVRMAVVSKIHHEANSAAVVPVFFAWWRVWRA